MCFNGGPGRRLAGAVRKEFVASGGTASLDEAISKKFAKKEMLLAKNLATVKRAVAIGSEWADKNKIESSGSAIRRPPLPNKGSSRMYNVAQVIDEKCVAKKGCRLCIMYCPEANCLDLNTAKMVAEVVISYRCKGCELCLVVCNAAKHMAIEMQAVSSDGTLMKRQRRVSRVGPSLSRLSKRISHTRPHGPCHGVFFRVQGGVWNRKTMSCKACLKRSPA